MKIRNKIMKKMFSTALIAVTTAVMTGCGVSVGELEEAPKEVEEESIVFSDKTLETRLIDNKVLYEDDDETSVVTMYLTVTKGNSSESTDHTWSEVNDHSVFYYDELGIARYGVNGLLQVGDENGPVEGELGYERQTPNCIVTIRGQTSSRAKQKNYKIKIKDSSGDWRGQTVINLNKHQSDGLRFRNKLMYDLIKEVDDLVAMRTQFVHLYVKDLTEGKDAEFEDYGLYTQVEQANKKFLKAHGLDKEGHLYKLNNIFEFYKYDEIKMVNDIGYDAMAFRYYLKTKGDTNNRKLINMLKDVNDSTLSGTEVLERWFDEDNVATWLGFNILLGNIDTQSRNMLLYSPLNVNKWYLINWDCDGALGLEEKEIHGINVENSWETGVSNYWGNMLFRKLIMDDTFRETLDKKINELRQQITPEKIRKMAEGYAEVVKPYLYTDGSKDEKNAPLDGKEYDRVINAIPLELEKNYESYKKSIEKPMPFYIGVPTNVENGINFVWEASYDIQSDDVYYTVTLADNYELKDPLLVKNDIFLNICTYDSPLPEGQYFLNVKARDSEGNEQYAFDYYISPDSTRHYGTLSFYVDKEGNISLMAGE